MYDKKLYEGGPVINIFLDPGEQVKLSPAPYSTYDNFSLDRDSAKMKITTGSGKTYIVADGMIFDTKLNRAFKLPEEVSFECGKPIFLQGMLVSTPVASMVVDTGRIGDEMSPLPSELDIDIDVPANAYTQALADQHPKIYTYADPSGMVHDTSNITNYTKPGSRYAFDTLNTSSGQEDRGNDAIIVTESGNTYYMHKGHVLNGRTGEISKVPHGVEIGLEVGSQARIPDEDGGAVITSTIKSISTMGPETGAIRGSGQISEFLPGKNPFESAAQIIDNHIQAQQTFSRT